jgi:hypothetical protein
MTDATHEAPVTFTFDTSHHAMWAEDVARERAFPVDVIPAPPETGARCGLALQTLGSTAASLETCFRDEGIEFSRWPASTNDPASGNDSGAQ